MSPSNSLHSLSFWAITAMTLLFTLTGHATIQKNKSTLNQAQVIEKESEFRFPLEILNISDDPRIQSSIFIADKAARKIYYFTNTSEFTSSSISYEIDIGKNDGDKQKRDDNRTPEGIFLLEKKLAPPEIPFSQYGSMAFTTDYPNFFDRFAKKTGSGIWLHSVPDSVPLTRGSRGCVVVRNDDIKKIEPLIQLKQSRLIISPQIQWVNQNTHQAELNKVKLWLKNWKANWETQNIDEYEKNYSDFFNAKEFRNKKDWMQHKRNVKSNTTDIQISMSEPNIYFFNNQLIIEFIQDYQSNLIQDSGFKTLYVSLENSDYKILREEWRAKK